MRRLALIAAPLALMAIAVTGCGSEEVSVSKSSPYYKGAQLFATNCSGCHTLDVAGTQGSATNVRDKEHTDGPNFNVKPETIPNVLYAIRNGGFSGKIMPQNIVTGEDAKSVAAFVAHYSGQDVQNVPSLQPTVKKPAPLAPKTTTTSTSTTTTP
jgi:mono/diheme cytochrome c family protein